MIGLSVRFVKPSGGVVQDPEVLTLYEIPEPPTYLQNIQNALKVYGCAPKHGDDAKLDKILTVIRMVRPSAYDLFLRFDHFILFQIRLHDFVKIST